MELAHLEAVQLDLLFNDYKLAKRNGILHWEKTNENHL